MLKKIRNKLIYYLVIVVFNVFGRMPWRLNLFLGVILAKLFFVFDFRYKKIAFKNLKLVYPRKTGNEIVNLAKKSYVNMGKNLFEYFLYRRINVLMPKIVEFEPESYGLLKSLYSENKGVIFLTAHFNNWELLGAVLALNRFNLAVFAKDIYIPELNRFVLNQRYSVGQTIISRGNTASLKYFLKALRERYIIAALIDQNIKNIKNETIPFLGINAPTPISVVELAIKYNIPSVIGFIYRLQNDKHKVWIKRIGSEFYNDKIKFATEMNNTISEMIKKYPEQWVWIHKRWD